VKFDPSTDAGVATAIRAAVEAGVPRSRIDRELVQAVTIEPDDEFRPILLAGRLFALARAHRRRTARQDGGASAIGGALVAAPVGDGD
jgi:hypothetical protein